MDFVFAVLVTIEIFLHFLYVLVYKLYLS